MSAYAHEMEREYSAQSLSSRGGSDMGSHYVVESGIYMTSLAATIFIGALTTVGVSLITLLIALVVMLQTCQLESSGAFDLSKSSDYYSYCKIFALHAEVNRLGVNEFPSICKDFANQYIKEGQYAKDLKFTMRLAENYFSSITPLDDGLDAVLLDIDDLSSSNPHYNNLYRSDDEIHMDTHEYFSRQRVGIQKEGFQITAVISSQMDALTGPCLGKRIFKIPNPMYYKFDDHIESANQLK